MSAYRTHKAHLRCYFWCFHSMSIAIYWIDSFRWSLKNQKRKIALFQLHRHRLELSKWCRETTRNLFVFRGYFFFFRCLYFMRFFILFNDPFLIPFPSSNPSQPFDIQNDNKMKTTKSYFDLIYYRYLWFNYSRRTKLFSKIIFSTFLKRFVGIRCAVLWLIVHWCETTSLECLVDSSKLQWFIEKTMMSKLIWLPILIHSFRQCNKIHRQQQLIELWI